MKKEEKDVVEGALERFRQSADDSSEIRIAAAEDIEFSRLGNQWPDAIRKAREEEDRPCLTINRHPSFIRNVVNEARQRKIGIIVAPVDNGADKDTADVIGGLIRSIERQSNAETAYDTALDNSVTNGFGFFRIGIDYAHPDSFEMNAYIERIPNPLMVHWDTRSTRFDAQDWEYAFVSEMLAKDVFERRYPKAEPVSFEEDTHEHDAYWTDNDSIRVAEYWLREEKTREIVLLSNGETIHAEKLEKLGKEQMQALGIKSSKATADELVRFFMQASGVEEVRRRESKYHTVTRRIMSGVEILETSPWPGERIPIVPVWGEEIFSGGRRIFRSMLRDARDPQKMHNFWRSATTELVALAPRAPWIGRRGFVPRGQEEKWRTANTRSHAFLEHEGEAMPQRIPFAGIPAGALQEAMSAADDIKAITGIYDSALGARSNETAGVAIKARSQESATSNFHFLDNLSRAIKYAGDVLVEIIPSVYSDRETIRILGPDMKEKVARLKQGAEGGKVYDLSVGRYDVTVKAGASFSTQREETRDALIAIMQEVPAAAPMIGDILLEHMDFPQAGTVARRLKHLLPPEVAQAEAAEGLQDGPPEAIAAVNAAQGQVSQLTQQLQAMQAQMGQMQAAVENKEGEIGLKNRELAIKEREVLLAEQQAGAEVRAKEAQISGIEQNNAGSAEIMGAAMEAINNLLAGQRAQVEATSRLAMTIGTMGMTPKAVTIVRGKNKELIGATVAPAIDPTAH